MMPSHLFYRSPCGRRPGLNNRNGDNNGVIEGPGARPVSNLGLSAVIDDSGSGVPEFQVAEFCIESGTIADIVLGAENHGQVVSEVS